MAGILQEVLLILLLVAINGFFAMAEIAVLRSSGVQMKHKAEAGSGRAAVVVRLLEDPSRFLATIQVGVTMAGFLASAAGAVTLSRRMGELLTQLNVPAALAGSLAVVLVTTAIAYVTLVAGELVPKRLALHQADRLALAAALPIEWVGRVTGPFITLLTATVNGTLRLLGINPEMAEANLSEEEIRLHVAEHKEIREEEKRLIEGVFEFGDRFVRQVMVPRTEMIGLRTDLPIAEVLPYLERYGYTEYPVYRESPDDITGIFNVKRLLPYFKPAGREAARKGPGEETSESSTVTVGKLAREPYFIPETKRTLDLLKEMQAKDIQTAVVVDEYGGTAGLVTLEDLLEEIVGDVTGETDEAISRVSPEELLVEADIEVSELNRQLDLELPLQGEYETLAGFLLYHLGRIPKEGDILVWEGTRFKVLEVAGRRIEKVRVLKPE